MNCSNKNKIIYFIGPGRSGSTILSIALSNYNDIAYYGELSSFWSLKGMPREGELENIKFWKNLLEKNLTLKNSLTKNYHKLFEHHYAIVNPKIFFRNKKEYLRDNRNLYEALFALSNKKILIDTSHYPLRAFWINKLQNYFDIYFIYLYRHPVQVINSFQKKGTEQNYKNPISANLYYFFVSILTFIVLFFIPSSKKIFIKYENFIENPLQEINKIKKFLSLDTNENIDVKNLLVPKYIIDGNRLRKKQKLSITKSNNILLLNKFWLLFTYFFQFPIMFINFFRKK